MCALAFVLISYTIQVQYEIVVQEEILWISGGGRKMIKEGIMDDISIDGSIALHTLTSENPKSRKGIHNGENIFDEKCIETGCMVIAEFIFEREDVC